MIIIVFIQFVIELERWWVRNRPAHYQFLRSNHVKYELRVQLLAIAIFKHGLGNVAYNKRSMKLFI